MKTTVLLSLVALSAGALATFASPDRAEADHDSCIPVAGRFTSESVPPEECSSPVGFCTRGQLTGALNGTYEFVMDQATQADPRVPGITNYSGESVVSTRRGATLTGVDTGTIDLNAMRDGNFVSLITFHTGTDYLAGAIGQIALRGKIDLEQGTTAGNFRGRLCF